MYFSLHPIFLIALVTLLGAVAFIVLAFLDSRKPKRGIILAVVLALLAPSCLLVVVLNPELVDARFRTYKRLYRNIRIGMTRQEVLVLVDRHYPPGGERMPPFVMEDSPNRLGFFMNPGKSTEPNCEGIFLQMKDGKVVGKIYSRD